MMEYTEQSEATRRPRRLNLPQQAPPVNRTGPRGAAGEAGIEADGIFDDILHGVTTYGPPVLGALGALGI